MKTWDKMFPLLKDEIDGMRKKLDILMDYIEEIKPQPPKKRGRPRKAPKSPQQIENTPEEEQNTPPMQ